MVWYELAPTARCKHCRSRPRTQWPEDEVRNYDGRNPSEIVARRFCCGRPYPLRARDFQNATIVAETVAA